MSCTKCGRESYWSGSDESPCKCRIRYVVGFLFDYGKRVLLINKTKPEWQKGKLNGIGGKIEPGETPLEAMIREFEEEAGLYIGTWSNFATFIGKDYDIYFYRANLWIVKDKPKSMTEEKIEWIEYDSLPAHIVPNLSWIIPMAIYMKRDHKAEIINRQLTAIEGQV